MNKQLALDLRLREETTFKNFYPGHNEPIISALQSLVAGSGERLIYLWGPSSAGRTHLLQACCHAMSEKTDAGIIYLPLKSVQLSPLILHDIENMQLVCLDDIEQILGQPIWEEALLHFYNRAREQGTRLVIAANQSPTQIHCNLADLRSRLSWGLVFAIKELSDEQKISALQIHSKERGMELSDEVGRFLLRHYPRDMTALFNLLDQLDQATFVEKRKLTVPFVREILA